MRDEAASTGGSPLSLTVLGGPKPSSVISIARPRRPELDRVVDRVRPSYDQGMLTNGRLVAELEERVADRLGVAHVVATSSCTSGLMLVVQALVEGRPGPVVMPSFTFSASAHSVAWNHRTPRFVEVDPLTFQVDVDHLAANLDGAAAVLAVHLFGAPCRPAVVERLARDAGVPLLFDAAHALGATSGERSIGGFGGAEVFSLTPTKVMVAGEGGLVATNDADLDARLRMGRQYGDPGNYDTQFVGMNARMSELHAAVALESLEMLDDSLAARRSIAARYRAALASVPGIEPQHLPDTDTSSYKDFTVSVDAAAYGLSRDQLVEVLSRQGVDTRNYFDPPVHRQHSYAGVGGPDLPVTDATSASVLSVPIYPDLHDDEFDRIVSTIATAHGAAEQIASVLGPMDRKVPDPEQRVGR